MGLELLIAFRLGGFRGSPRDAGSAMVEVLIATVILLIVMAVSFDLLRAAQATFVTQPEALDLSQRLRAVAESRTFGFTAGIFFRGGRSADADFCGARDRRSPNRGSPGD